MKLVINLGNPEIRPFTSDELSSPKEYGNVMIVKNLHKLHICLYLNYLQVPEPAE